MSKCTDLCFNRCWLQRSRVMSLLHYNLIITPVPTLHFLLLTHRDPAVLVIDTNIVPLPGNGGLGVTPGRDTLQHSGLSCCHHHIIGRLAEIIPENYGRLRQVLAVCCVLFVWYVFICSPVRAVYSWIFIEKLWNCESEMNEVSYLRFLLAPVLKSPVILPVRNALAFSSYQL